MGKERSLEEQLAQFRVCLLREKPFYGEVLARTPIEADCGVETAATNGAWIRYCPTYFAGLSQGERNYVWMHELLHILLMHWKRQEGRNGVLWNIAADYVVNGMLDRMAGSFSYAEIPFKRPREGTYLDTYQGESAEELYAALDAKAIPIIGICIGDLAPCSQAEEARTERLVRARIAEATRSVQMGKGEIPREMMHLVQSRLLPWKRILARFLEEIRREEPSYLTPERKVLYRGLILPGYGGEDEEVPQIWAFLDCSGSISRHLESEFLTQLYRILSQVGAVLNLAYWDAQVQDVICGIREKGQVFDCARRSSGGTDLTCVYQYLHEGKINAKVVLILTDGWFWDVEESLVREYRSRTIVVVPRDGNVNLERYGTVCRL